MKSELVTFWIQKGDELVLMVMCTLLGWGTGSGSHETFGQRKVGDLALRPKAKSFGILWPSWSYHLKWRSWRKSPLGTGRSNIPLRGMTSFGLVNAVLNGSIILVFQGKWLSFVNWSTRVGASGEELIPSGYRARGPWTSRSTPWARLLSCRRLPSRLCARSASTLHSLALFGVGSKPCKRQWALWHN